MTRDGSISGGKAAILSKEYFTTHGVHVAHRIGSGDRPVIVRIINDWRKEVSSTDNSLLVVQPVDSRIVSDTQAYQHLGMRFSGE